MYQAYADHRPFVLSPDMIWLLISQGFARHINANQESMRNELVDFSGKLSLIIREDKIGGPYSFMGGNLPAIYRTNIPIRR